MLHEFNQEYRRRRLEAQGRGEPFMGYAQAMARLRRAILLVSDPDLGADIWMALFNTNHLAKIRLRLTRRAPRVDRWSPVLSV